MFPETYNSMREWFRIYKYLLHGALLHCYIEHTQPDNMDKDTPYNHRLPMAERVGRGTPACYEVWVCGRSWVRALAGEIVRRIFHPTRKLVRFSLLKCPSVPNSKKNLKYVVPVGKCKL